MHWLFSKEEDVNDFLNLVLSTFFSFMSYFGILTAVISLKVTFLQGKNGGEICQVSWPWDCNWEISPSVHTQPEKYAQVGAGVGCKWPPLARQHHGFTLWVQNITTYSGHQFCYCEHVLKVFSTLAILNRMLDLLSIHINIISVSKCL